MRPPKDGMFLVKLVDTEAKVGSIIMPNFKYTDKHNAAKQFRFQKCTIVDTCGNDYYGLKEGDTVIFRRWGAKQIGKDDLACLETQKILAKVE